MKLEFLNTKKEAENLVRMIFEVNVKNIYETSLKAEDK